MQTRLNLCCSQIPGRDHKLFSTLKGNEIEVVHEYKFLGVVIDESLTFNQQIEKLVMKLRIKQSFYLCNKLCFSVNAKNQLVAATFLPVLDYGDVLYMNASAKYLYMVDIAYHASLRFIPNCKPLTDHCELYCMVGWSTLATRRLSHWYTFIHKVILGLLPVYICSLRAQRSPGPCRTFVCKSWKLIGFISLRTFKSKLKAFVAEFTTCTCF